MRKLSLFIIAAGATLGVSLAQADDVVDGGIITSDGPEVLVDPVPEVHVDPMPGDAGQTAEPVFVLEEIDLPHPVEPSVDLIVEGGEEIVIYPVDQVVEVTSEGGDPAVETTDDTVTTEDTGTTDDMVTTEDTGTTDDMVTTEDTGTTDDMVTTEDTGTTDDMVTTEDTGTTDDMVTTEDTGTTDDTVTTDDTGTTDEKVLTDDALNVIMYNTTSGTVDPRPEGCMQCRTLTGETADAVEAPAPEVMVDVLDGNSTGVDVMDPVEGKKRSSH